MIEIYEKVNSAVKIDEAIDYLERVQYTKHMCDEKTHEAIDDRMMRFVTYDDYMLCKMVYTQVKGMELEKTVKMIDRVAENIEARELLSLIEGVKTIDELQVLKENYTSIKMRMVIDERKKRLMVQSKLDAVRFLQNVRVTTNDDEVLRRFNDWYNAKTMKGKEVNADDMRARLTSIRKGREDEIKNENATRTMIGWANTVEILDSLHTSVAGDEILQRMFDFKRKVLIEKEKMSGRKHYDMESEYNEEGSQNETEIDVEDEEGDETESEDVKYDENGQVIKEGKRKEEEKLKENSSTEGTSKSDDEQTHGVKFDEDGMPYMEKKRKSIGNELTRRVTQMQIEHDLMEREKLAKKMNDGSVTSSSLSVGTIDTQV
jgi:hypothetical protein